MKHHITRFHRWLMTSPWTARFPWLRALHWTDAALLGGCLLIVLLGWGFVELADEVREGETMQLDEQVIRSLRRADDPAVPVGPAWLREAALDITAMGSVAVLVFVVTVVACFLLLLKQYRLMALVLIASIGGSLLGYAIKQLIGRERPDIVPHLREVITLSFPSGHATASAVVYLTLAAILAQVVRSGWAKLYILGVAVLLTLLVGATRVYLGVHYPTDVLAGWTLGFTWALACWMIAAYLQHRARRRGGDALSA